MTPQLLWSVFSLAAVFRAGLCFVFGAHAVLTVFRETLGPFCHQARVLLTPICNVVLINTIAAVHLEEIQKKTHFVIAQLLLRPILGPALGIVFDQVAEMV